MSTRVDVATLQQVCSEPLQAVGLSAADAALAAAAILLSETEGAASHGLIRLPLLVARLKAGLVNPHTHLEIVHATTSTALIDAHNSVGLVVSARAMDVAITRARDSGIGAVAVRESSHLGRTGHPAAQAARAGFIGYAASNASPRVVAQAGATPILGNNPWAFAFPTAGEPLVIDMANSVVAAGKIRVAQKEGKEIPLGWALDSDGHPTRDPQQALDGALLCFGGHKGWALSLIVDVLAGVLSGGAFAADPPGVVDDMSRQERNSHFFLALDPTRFLPREQFIARMDALQRALQEAAGPDGRLPGTRSQRLRRQHLAEGLLLSRPARDALDRARRDAGLPPWQPDRT